MPNIEISHPRRIPPVFLALMAQVFAFVLSGMVLVGFHSLAWRMDFTSFLALQSVLALSISARMGMSVWWWVIQALFVPALVAALTLSIAPVWFLLSFIFLVMIYGSTYTTQVPLYLSRKRVWLAVARVLPPQSGVRVLDLGSGLGGLVRHLADARSDCHVSGIESAPLPCWLSKLRMLGRRNANIEWGDFWHADLSSYDVVCAYLSPVPMPDLWQKVQREMRPGSLFISYRFAVPGVMPTQIVELHDLGKTELYVWRV